MRATTINATAFGVFVAISAIATLAHAEPYTVCIGEKEHNCPRAYHTYRDCSVNSEEDQIKVAQELCTVIMPNGEKKITPVRNTRMFSISGDACGYIIYEVTCLGE